MQIERMLTWVRGRRTTAVLTGLVVLVLAGAMVAAVDDGAQDSPAVVGGRSADTAAGTSPFASGSSQPQAVQSDEAAAMSTGSGAGSRAGASAPPEAPALGTVRNSTTGGSAGTANGPKVVKTANLRVEVGKGRFRAAFGRAMSVAEEHGGFVASSSQATVDDKASEGTVSIRVPVDRFEAARTALAGLGTVEHLELSGQDVTAQIVDYDARIRNLQAQEQALSTLLSRAGSIGEVLEVQGQVFAVRQQIEQLQAERTNLDNQASMATISTTVFEPGAAVVSRPEPRTGLARSWDRALDAAVAVIGGTVVVLGIVVPLAVLALLGWAGWRLAHRRRPVAPTPAA